MIRLTDAQWELIREHFPEENYPAERVGRKPVPARKVLEAVLWILNTGAQWHMLPQCYPNYKTVHRRFQQWCQNEVLRGALTDLANQLREASQIDESECFIDATFASAKGGGEQIGPTRRGKGVKIMAIVDRHGLPLAVTTHAANHHEVTLVQLTFDFYMIEAKPENLIGDRAYDSDKLDEQLKAEGIEMISPHRMGRVRPATQDGRRLRRYQRRWIVERFFAWMQWHRRLRSVSLSSVCRIITARCERSDRRRPRYQQPLVVRFKSGMARWAIRHQSKALASASNGSLAETATVTAVSVSFTSKPSWQRLIRSHPGAALDGAQSVEDAMTDKQRVQILQRQLTEMAAAFCRQHADAEYERMCKKLIDKMARKRVVPFLSGRVEIWAAAIVYALGSINFLFDKSFAPHAPPDALCQHFQSSKRTVTQKAKLIRDMFNLGYFDPEFSTEHMAGNNPLSRLHMVNGFLVIDEP